MELHCLFYCVECWFQSLPRSSQRVRKQRRPFCDLSSGHGDGVQCYYREKDPHHCDQYTGWERLITLARAFEEQQGGLQRGGGGGKPKPTSTSQGVKGSGPEMLHSSASWYDMEVCALWDSGAMRAVYPGLGMRPSGPISAVVVQTSTAEPPPTDSCSTAVPSHLQQLYAASTRDLREAEQVELAELLHVYADVFSTGPTDLGHTNLVQHDIQTRPGPPVKQQPRRMAFEKQQSADEQIQQNLDAGLASPTKWFSTLDLASGYWQVELTPQARQAAAFCSRKGLFAWNVMPYIYPRLDDIIVLGKDVSEMLQRLAKVFERLHQANLKLKPVKCCLFRRRVVYLGHIISEHGIATDPEKVRKICEWPQPMSVNEVRQFVGLASYYRRFVKDFATVAKPLHNLLRKHARFHWTSESQQAFDKLKELLTTAPILGYPMDSGDLILDTDASNFGIGAVLSQLQQGEERVLAYGSRSLTSTEQNYCTTRRELLAEVEFTTHFRQYLLGRSFTNPIPSSPQLCHQAVQCDFNGEPLSNLPAAVTPESCRVGVVQPASSTNTSSFSGWTTEELRAAQAADPDIAPIKRWMKESEERPSWEDVSPNGPATKAYWSQWQRLYLKDDILVRRFYLKEGPEFYPQIILPQVYRENVMLQKHEGPVGGHFGVERTLSRLQTRYYWCKMREDVSFWCRTCTSCAAKA
ncbi:hypothetical protein QQF64_012882 [Cirrhinus molitorella]|uniref:Gypsy retrotransposon integrase-like protein 1 n=1 Tax=Cirrhinus molitorella TaxID=172907 RepID=A0ABR3LRW9_9TELE